MHALADARAFVSVLVACVAGCAERIRALWFFSKQLVIKNKEIESAMVKAFVSLRNICRVMKLRVVHDADRLELELEAEALGSLLTMLVGAIRKKNSATVDAFAAVVDASNGLQGDEIGQR